MLVPINFWFSSRYEVATPNLGIYFHEAPFADSANLGARNLKPQVTNPPDRFLEDTLNWMKVDAIYEAKGGEKHFTIGIFTPRDSTPIKLITGNPDWSVNASSRYYIDDVSVVPLNHVLGTDTFICPHGVLELDPGISDANIRWQDGSTNSTYIATEPGIYWMELVVQADTFRDSITVFPATGDQLAKCECKVFIPNAFTPNNDGLNDTFAPSVPCDFTYMNLKVYNRWGQEVFSGNAAWDGFSRGHACPEDMYFYRVEYRIDKPGGPTEEYRTGTVNLLRPQ